MIAHPNNAVLSLERRFVEDAFLKKVKTWPTGELIRPVDQLASAAVRKQFSEGVLRRSVAAVRSYWQGRIFSGRDLPPPELGSDAEVVGYVARHPGAIGYVSDGAAVDGVSVISVR